MAVNAVDINVRLYGAKGDGSTNDTSAIQTALAAAGTGDVVVFPAGTYVVNDSLTVAQSSITLRGEGRRLSVLKSSASGDALVLNNGGTIRYVGVEGLHVLANGAAGSGIKTVSAIECWIRNTTVTGFTAAGKYGLEMTGGGNTFLCSVSESTFAGCANGAYVSGQMHTFTACRFQGNASDGLYDDATGATFVGCDFEGNGRHGCYLFQNRNKHFFGCYWESNITSQVYSYNSHGLLIAGGVMSGGVDATPHGVRLGVSGGGDQGVAIIGLHAKLHATADIDIVTCSDGAILGCRLDSTTKVRGSFASGLAQIPGIGTRLTGTLEAPSVVRVATGEEVIDRDAGSGVTAAGTSGQMLLSYFTAQKTEAWAKQRFWTAGTAAGATPTLIRAVAYKVESNGAHTEIASSTSDTALLASANTAYDFTWDTPTSRTAGQRYAVGLLVVTSAAMPTMLGVQSSASNSQALLWGVDGRLASAYSGLTDLPASGFGSGPLGNTTRRVQSVCLPA